MDTASIVTKASSTIPEIVAISSPLVVTCVTLDAGSRMTDSHTMPTTIACYERCGGSLEKEDRRKSRGHC